MLALHRVGHDVIDTGALHAWLSLEFFGKSIPLAATQWRKRPFHHIKVGGDERRQSNLCRVL